MEGTDDGPGRWRPGALDRRRVTDGRVARVPIPPPPHAELDANGCRRLQQVDSGSAARSRASASA